MLHDLRSRRCPPAHRCVCQRRHILREAQLAAAALRLGGGRKQAGPGGGARAFHLGQLRPGHALVCECDLGVVQLSRLQPVVGRGLRTGETQTGQGVLCRRGTGWCLLVRVVSGTVRSNGAAGRLDANATGPANPACRSPFQASTPSLTACKWAASLQGSRGGRKGGVSGREKGGARKKAGAAGRSEWAQYLALCEPRSAAHRPGKEGRDATVCCSAAAGRSSQSTTAAALSGARIAYTCLV